jgi:hypothetical protein
MHWIARHRLAALGVTLVVVLAAATGTLALRAVRSQPEAPEATLPAAAVPSLGHVWVIVMENKGYDAITQSSDMPYLHSLMAQGAVPEDYSAVSHPSQPNYLALFSGSTHGVKDDASHDLQGQTVADQLEAAGLTWRVVAENYPGDCFTGSKASDGRDGQGTYARKHDPAISFVSISGSPERCANIVDMTAFDPGAANVQFIAPNLCHDMHDCSLAEGDRWLSAFVPRITDSAAFKAGGALFITFDEGEELKQSASDSPNSNRVLTVAVSPRIAAGTRSSVPYTHYSLLRTIEASFGLPCLDESCEANDMADMFRPAGAPPATRPPVPASLTPSP